MDNATKEKIVSRIDEMGWHGVAEAIRAGRRTVEISGTDVVCRQARRVKHERNYVAPLCFPELATEL